MKKGFIIAIAIIALFVFLVTKNSNDGATPSTSSKTQQHTQSQEVQSNIISSDVSVGGANTENTENNVTTIGNLLQLRDYLNNGLSNGTTSFKFKYTGSESVNYTDIARITCALYVEGEIKDGIYDINISKFPGDKMVAAYFSSDYSKLTSEEKLTLNQAIDMVKKAKENSSNNFELEMNIHDMLVDTITYVEEDSNFSGAENAPWSLTAIGAIRDKKANCQGYTDAFYLLGSIAGFKVDRIFITNSEGPHMANTIQLDNQWYILDVTHNDRDNEEFKCYYRFNAGCDMLNDYAWKPEWEYNPIAKNSSNQFYYKNKNAIYNNINAMADALVSQWNGSGILTANVMVQTQANKTDIEAAFNSRLNSLGVKYNYTYWYKNDGNNTYLSIKITN